MNIQFDSEDFEHDFYSSEDVKSRMLKYQSEVIDAICEHYESGAIDDETKNHQFMSLIACLCEGKITAKRDESSEKILWRLSEISEKKVSKWKTSITKSSSKADKKIDKDKESK